MNAVCAREAISGTTPPNLTCCSIEVEITEDRISLPPRITAAAVSSQLDSIASITASFFMVAVFVFSK